MSTDGLVEAALRLLPEHVARAAQETLEKNDSLLRGDSAWRNVALRLAKEISDRDAKLQTLESKSSMYQARMQNVLDQLHSLSAGGSAAVESFSTKSFSSNEGDKDADDLISPSRQRPTQPKTTQLESVSVMIIEDDDFQRASLHALCESLGFASVQSHASAESALAVLTGDGSDDDDDDDDAGSRQQPHLILLDIELGASGNGFTFIDAIRDAVGNSAAIVMVSMFHSQAMMERALIHDADS